MTDVYRGILLAQFKTGFDGLHWGIQRDDVPGHGGLVLIRAGDYLEIYSEENELVFSSIIKPDKQAGLESQSNSEEYNPTACSYWVNWIQEGMVPDQWAKFFLPMRYRGMLIRNSERR